MSLEKDHQGWITYRCDQVFKRVLERIISALIKTLQFFVTFGKFLTNQKPPKQLIYEIKTFIIPLFGTYIYSLPSARY